MNIFFKTSKTVFIYAILILGFWTAIVGVLAYYNMQITKKTTMSTIASAAQLSFNKDLAYRKWASSHGGVYVQPSKKTPPSPWMSHIKERDIVTTDGKTLTLMNPAYMLREMMQDYSALYGVKGRIVGKIYLNANNEADAWEAKAIESFDKGVLKIEELVNINGEEYFRLMEPMMMEQSCQKCHGHLGFKNGSVRGGISVSIPTKIYKENENSIVNQMLLTYFFIWLFGFIVIVTITLALSKHLKKREKELEEIVLSSKVFENVLDAIFITDKSGNILRVNKAFTTLTGYKADEVVGKNPRLLKSHLHDESFYNKFWQDINKKGYVEVEIHNAKKNGDIFVAIESITSVEGNDKKVKYFISTMHDITARKESEKKIKYLAHYDQLTNLPNRTLFQDRLQHSIDLAKRHNYKLALAFIDIDGFKNINDTMGHDIGDKLLIEIAKIIQTQTRLSDSVARLGGDEFTIIFEQIVDNSTVINIQKKILNALREEIIIENHSIFISASIGISMYPSDGEDTVTLLKNADTAMYRAKDSGKNNFCFYEPSMTQSALEKVELENSILSAINNKEMVVYYQAKVSAQDKSVVGMEALVRWISPTKGMIPPDKFIPVSENMHVVDKIDMYVLEQVCVDMQEWFELGFENIVVSVNLSGYDISIPNIYETIIDIVSSNHINPQNIDFEITETYFSKFEEMEMQTLKNLKAYGFSLSIDDFGTGYSSLNNLKKLPVNILKIDQSFIKDLDENEENKKLATMIINLAHMFSLKTVAEGVETESHFNYLQSESCDYIQGYLENKPMPKDEFIKYLKGKKSF